MIAVKHENIDFCLVREIYFSQNDNSLSRSQAACQLSVSYTEVCKCNPYFRVLFKVQRMVQRSFANSLIINRFLQYSSFFKPEKSIYSFRRKKEDRGFVLVEDVSHALWLKYLRNNITPFGPPYCEQA